MRTISRVTSGFAAALIFGVVFAGSETDERKQQIRQIEAEATPAALARKKRSDDLLRREGVSVNKSLPAIKDETQVRARTREEIASRAMALLLVSIKGNGLESDKIDRLVQGFGVEPHFSPKERAFIRDRAPSQQERDQFSWRYEAAWVLLWSLGYVEELGKPTAPCDVDKAILTLIDRGSERFIAEAKLRPLPEIVEQADRIYRYHWAVVDARIKGGKAAGLNSDVVVERHKALNWLIGYLDQAWDDVSTDT